MAAMRNWRMKLFKCGEKILLKLFERRGWGGLGGVDDDVVWLRRSDRPGNGS